MPQDSHGGLFFSNLGEENGKGGGEETEALLKGLSTCEQR